MKLPPGRLVALLLAVLVPAARLGLAQGFQGLYTRDGIDVIAVGDKGVTYRTLDAGLNWTESVVGSSTLTLRDVTGRGLEMLIASDGGLIWSSVDAGGHWTSTLAPASPDLKAAAMASDSVWIVAGSGGSILRSANAGASWNVVTSGTSQALNALRFADAQHGWAAGNGGTLLATANGGVSWSPVTLGTSNALWSVDQRGATVWVVGAEGAAWRSTNGGAAFDPVDLRLDARADVRSVMMLSPDTLWLAGGGGFIRYTTNGGATWTFQQHSLQAPITRLLASGAGVWAANSKNRVVMSSTNRGATWRFPTGATLGRGWGATPRYAFGGQVRGSGFAINPVYKSTIYCGIGGNVVRSRDDGDTWQVAASFPTNYSKCNAFIVSPKDSNVWLAALSGPTVSDRVYRTTNGGTSWMFGLVHDFGEYGIPLEMDPDRPDTVWFGGENDADGLTQSALYRSFDFGATWDSVNTALFRSPCDILVVPDTTGIVIVGDGVTGLGNGQYLKSVDGGHTFSVASIQASSEIPGLATSRLRPATIFGTNWSSGGVQRSTNYGNTWPTVDNSVQAWGIDIAKDDPNMVLFGQYSFPFNTLLSLDGGNSFRTITSPTGFNNNYGLFLRDRATVLAEQSSGIWKMQTNYFYTPAVLGQTLQISSPTGGESWAGGSVQDITWTSTGVAVARIEYRRTLGEPWQFVADVGGYVEHYAWRVPRDVTTDAKLRLYDLWDAVPLDSMSDVITILTPRLERTPASLDFGQHGVGAASVLPLTIKNAGTATLHVSSIATATGTYAAGRTSLTLAPSQQDTVGIWFMPTSAGTFADTVTIASDDSVNTPSRVAVTGGAVGPGFSSTPDTLHLPTLQVGYSASNPLRIGNTGNAPLAVSTIAVTNPRFWVGRKSLVVAAGGVDTVGVYYRPTAAVADTTTLAITSNDAGSPHVAVAVGRGIVSVDVGPEATVSFALGQNRPNPFSRATLIQYTLARESNVTLDVFDLRGQRVARLVGGRQPAGPHEVRFGAGATDAAGTALLRVPAGMYFYRLEAGALTATRKMLLVE